MNRKLFFYAFAACAFLLPACSGDDGIAYKETDLIGKWYDTSGNNANCEKDYIEYTQGHVYRGIHWVVAPSGSSEGDCLATDAIGNSYGQSWTLKGNKITIIFGPVGGTSKQTIKKLTVDSLEVEDENGAVSTYTAN